MAYANLSPWVAAPAANLVQAADTSLFSMTLPTGHRDIQVFAITQIVNTATGASDGATNDYPTCKLLKGTTTMQTCTAMAAEAAIGTATYDVIAEPVLYRAGDKIDIQISERSKTSGKYDVILWVM